MEKLDLSKAVTKKRNVITKDKEENASHRTPSKKRKKIFEVKPVVILDKSIPDKTVKKEKKDFLSSIPEPVNKGKLFAKETTQLDEVAAVKKKSTSDVDGDKLVIQSETTQVKPVIENDEFEDIDFFAGADLPRNIPISTNEPQVYSSEFFSPIIFTSKIKHTPQNPLPNQICPVPSFTPNSYENLPEGTMKLLDSKRKKNSVIQFKEISQEKILEDRFKYQTLDVTKTRASTSTSGDKYTPSISMKRKHNILSLAYDSKLNAQALEEARSQSRAMRKITRQQYGF